MKLTEQEKQDRATARKQKRVRERWAEALVSGEYKQGTGVLHRLYGKRHTFCCLGVLCELAVKAKVIDKPAPDEDDSTFYYDNAYDTPTDSVLEWAGLNDDQVQDLVTLNDDYKKSFKTIAKLVVEPESIGAFLQTFLQKERKGTK